MSELEDIYGKILAATSGYAPGTTGVFVEVRLSVGEWTAAREAIWRDLDRQRREAWEAEEAAIDERLSSAWRASAISEQRMREMLEEAYDNSPDDEWRRTDSVDTTDLVAELVRMRVEPTE